MRLSCFPSPRIAGETFACARRVAAVPSAGELLRMGRSGEVSASTYASQIAQIRPG